MGKITRTHTNYSDTSTRSIAYPIFTFYLKPNNTPPTAPSTSFISFNKSCDHTTTRHYLAPLIKNDSRKRTSHQSLLQGLDRRFHRLHRVPRRPCQMEAGQVHPTHGRRQLIQYHGNTQARRSRTNGHCIKS